MVDSVTKFNYDQLHRIASVFTVHGSMTVVCAINFHYIKNKKVTNWLGRQNAAPIKFHQKPSGATFSAVFRTSINPYRK